MRALIVAALYVDLRGPYPAMPGVECWGLPERDALQYDGPHPVVAHPPCGPWGRLRHMCTLQDPACGPRAVEQVRRWGGVLEHPEHSLLWRACGMPRPNELPDAWGGRTIAVEQVRWGHVARKRTWLYLVGVEQVPSDPPPREPVAWISGDRARERAKHGTCLPPGKRHASSFEARATPPAFAEYLVSLARQARGA